jgi:antitoxin component YwqK of YwqJK toxin-antitoxin module
MAVMKILFSTIILVSMVSVISAQTPGSTTTNEKIQVTQYTDDLNYTFDRKDADGNLMESGSFKAGKPDGIWINYNANGTISGKGNYLNGKKEGDWSFFTLEGLPAYIVTYHEGLRTEAIQLDERGNTLAETKTKE